MDKLEYTTKPAEEERKMTRGINNEYTATGISCGA